MVNVYVVTFVIYIFFTMTAMSMINFSAKMKLVLERKGLHLFFLCSLSSGYVIVFIGKMIYFPYIFHLITEGIPEFRPPGHSNIDLWDIVKQNMPNISLLDLSKNIIRILKWQYYFLNDMQVSKESNTLSSRKEHRLFEVILPSQSLFQFLTWY